MVLFFYQVGEADLIGSGHFVKPEVARGRGSLLIVMVICFQERGQVCVWPRLLPPGKLSFLVVVVLRPDAEDLDVQVGGDLEAHARTVARQIQKREDLQNNREEQMSAAE